MATLRQIHADHDGGGGDDRFVIDLFIGDIQAALDHRHRDLANGEGGFDRLGVGFPGLPYPKLVP